MDPVIAEHVNETLTAIADECHTLSQGVDPARPEKRSKAERLAEVMANLCGLLRVALALPTPAITAAIADLASAPDLPDGTPASEARLRGERFDPAGETERGEGTPRAD